MSFFSMTSNGKERSGQSYKISETQAMRYCEDLLSVDEQIVAVAIVDPAGELLGLDWKRERVPWEGQSFEQRKEFESIQGKLGAWVKIILSLSEETAPLIGRLERAIFVHKKFQLILLGSPSKGCNVGCMVARSTDAGYIARKVAEILGEPL